MFARPMLLTLLLALPVWWWLRRRARRPAAEFSDLQPLVSVAEGRRWIGEVPAGLRSVALGGYLIYETFATGNERFGKPSNPDYLLREGELLEVLAGEFDVIESEHTEVQTPKPAVVQRICARRQDERG